MLTGVFLALAAGQAGRIEATLSREKGETLLRVGAGEPQRVDGRFTAVALAPGGRRALLHAGPGGPLAYVRVGGAIQELADAARAPRWAPDGAHAIYVDRSGALRVFNAALPLEAAAKVAERTRGAAFAPDSSRVAYADEDGLWIVPVDGGPARRIVRNRTATAIAWHPDGRTIAFVEPGLGQAPGRLHVVKATGSALKPVGPLAADVLEYSPNGRHLLVGNGGSYQVVSATAGKPLPVPTSIGAPQWTSSTQLRIATATGIVALDVATGKEQRLKEPVAGLTSYAADPQPDLSGDQLFASPFRGASAPQTGQIRIEGVIADANPLDAEFTVAVQAVVEPNGRETRFARPMAQPIVLGARAQLTDGNRTRPLRTIDLLPEAEVSLWLRTPRLDPAKRVEAEMAWVEGVALGAVEPLLSAPRLRGDPVDYDGVSPEKVVVPLVFPVAGRCNWSDTFLADRAGGRRRHHGQDLMAAKMTPLVACFDGVVYLGRGAAGGHYTIRVEGDNGWIANYYHVNNDNPGTDDGLGGDANAFAPGLESGQRVFAGQFIGYVGDSGNAEGTAPHLHFELWDSVTSAVVNAAPSLRSAQRLEAPAAKVVDPSLKPSVGEVRLDGTIHSIDASRKVVRLTLLSRTERGKTRSITRHSSLYVAWQGKIDAHLMGNEAVAVDFSDLRPGLYAACIGQPPATGRAMVPRKAAFATP